MGAGSPPHHAGRRRGVHSERTPKGRLGPGNDDVSSSGEAHRHGRAGGRDAKRTGLARPSMPWGRVSVSVLVACGLLSPACLRDDLPRARCLAVSWVIIAV